MVKIALQVMFEMGNVSEVKSSAKEFTWVLKFSCSNCGETSGNWDYLSLNVPIPTKRGKSVNHFASKCKFCSRENTVTILEDSIKSYYEADIDNYKTLVVFDCRGLEPIDFSPGRGWKVEATNSGSIFEDIDLSPGEWEEYCVQSKQPVFIHGVKHKFEKIK